jgi:hypothetical protein
MLPTGLMSAALALPPQAGCTPQFAPLDTGTSSSRSPLPIWRKIEAGAWAGGGWLGWSHERSTLVPVAITVRDLPGDRTADADEVTVEAIPKVTFAVRCVPSVRAGVIHSTGVLNHSLRSRRVLRVEFGRA